MRRVISNMGQWLQLTLLVTQRFEKNKKPFMVTIGKPPKTHEQLGYLHTEVLPKLAQAYFDAGDIQRNNENMAKYLLKRKIGFGEYYQFKDGVVFDPKSFSDASIDDLIIAIDTATYEAAQRGVYVNPPAYQKK